MKLLKVSLLSLALFLFLVNFTNAEVSTLIKTPSGSVSSTIAKIGVYNIKIISQKENVIHLSFDIKNRIGAFSDLKYSVSLVKNTPNGQVVVDSYLYPETFNVTNYSLIKKDIIYNAPLNLNGEYNMFIKIINNAGNQLTIGSVGLIKLISTTKSVEFIDDTCFVSVSPGDTIIKSDISKSISIDPTSSLVFTCNAINSSNKNILVTPFYEIHNRNLYGDVFAQGSGTTEPISFKPGEKKSITFTLPQTTKPQFYSAKIFLKTDEIPSTPVIVNYSVKGIGATIDNLSVGKGYYQKGDKLKINLLWTPLSLEKENTTVSSSISVVDRNNKDCIKIANRVLDYNINGGDEKGFIDVIRECINPTIQAELKDLNGNILDSKKFSFISDSKTVEANSLSTKIKTIFNNILNFIKNNIIYIGIFFGVLVVTGITIYFINLKKKKDFIQNNLSNSNEKII